MSEHVDPICFDLTHAERRNLRYAVDHHVAQLREDIAALADAEVLEVELVAAESLVEKVKRRG